jgi:hypothetical protein
MLDNKSLQSATIIGTMLQVAMVVCGHFVAWIALNLFALGGMAISALAGFLYARRSGAGYGSAALGGALAGGICALIGIAISVAMKDTPAMILAVGTLGSAVTGALGGLIGKLASGGGIVARN